MDYYSAQKIIKCYYNSKRHTKEDEFLFTEALDFLIEETHDPQYMLSLGSYYYCNKQFELAKDYYELAASCNYKDAYSCLGYIYYYGRTGEPDYQKAYKYYKLAYESGDLEGGYKLADMIKNGYYVEKDYDKYCSIILDLYNQVRDMKGPFDPVPEIYSRLASIYKKQGKRKEAAELLDYALPFMIQRSHYNYFFGDQTIIRYMVNDLYDLVEYDIDNVQLFDLYYLFNKPAKVKIVYKQEEYFVEAIKENEKIIVKCEQQYFEDVIDFFARFEIDGVKIARLALRIDYMEVISWNK